MHKIIKILVGIVCVLLTHKTSIFAEPNAQNIVDSAEIVFQQYLDSVGITTKEIEDRVSSTRVFGGSSPVSFSGEARVKAAYHNLNSDMEWTEGDRSYIQSGWDGNESMMRIGMVVRPDRNTVLWSKIGFQSTFPGFRFYKDKNIDGSIAQYLHDKSMITANIHEDMCAGIAIRTVPASFMLKMGNINWVEASPFTIWKAQPRTFAWEYLPYEIEQPIGRYYEYNVAKGEKAGRAAWHKKPFNGIDFESISLPANLYLNILWATYERYDNYEQEYVDFSNDIAYAGDEFPLKGTGIGDSYRHIFHLRLAKNKMIGELTPGFNLCMYNYNDDVIMSQDNNGYLFLKALGVYDGAQSPLPVLKGKAFYKEPKIFSFDLRGKVGDLLELHSDVAIGRVDTTYLMWDSLPNNEFTKNVSSSSFVPAFYTKIAFNKFLPIQLDIAAIGKGFYSPTSFVAQQDAFYAYGSNLVGSGKFISRGEASPYVQNMAGALVSYVPKVPGYGHVRVAYGQHFQIQPGRDILYFPYRLNGIDFFSFWHSSYVRWGQMMLPDPKGKNQQKGRRLGNESFLSSAYDNPVGIEGGGVYTDYLATLECFVPWDDPEQARKNLASQAQDVSYTRVVDGDTSLTAFVPVHRKFTNNLEIDVAYDISSLIGFPNDFFLGGYAAINNVTTAFSPLAISEKGDNTQLWSIYLRFEPAIALTKRFYLLGILGFENWRSQKTLMNIRYDSFKNKYLGESVQPLVSSGSGSNRIALYRVPIDYRDMAIGLGFDWEILSRVGVHGRFKYMSHKDVNFSYNDWSTPVVSMEIKTWF